MLLIPSPSPFLLVQIVCIEVGGSHELVFLIQVASEEERSKEGNQSPNSGSIQGSPRRVRSETLLIDRVAPLLRRMRHSQSMGLDKRLTPEPKPTIERFLEA